MIKRFGGVYRWAEVEEGCSRQRLYLEDTGTPTETRDLFHLPLYLVSMASCRAGAQYYLLCKWQVQVSISGIN